MERPSPEMAVNSLRDCDEHLAANGNYISSYNKFSRIKEIELSALFTHLLR
jgi:hypothetical protein